MSRGFASFAALVESYTIFLAGQLSATISGAQVAEKFFQLEEMEDKETCTTEVFLKSDSTVEIGKTDGPVHVKARGEWETKPDGTFRMLIARTYETGKDQSTFTDMGEFEYEVERTYTGDFTMIGGLVGVQGVIHNVDEVLGDEEVGYFNMIDTTKERLGQEEGEE